MKLKINFENKFYDTGSIGIPQGSPIAPIIANIVLDGLEKHIKDSTKFLKTKFWFPKVTIIRYADDIIITGASKWV